MERYRFQGGPLPLGDGAVAKVAPMCFDRSECYGEQNERGQGIPAVRRAKEYIAHAMAQSYKAGKRWVLDSS